MLVHIKDNLKCSNPTLTIRSQGFDNSGYYLTTVIKHLSVAVAVVAVGAGAEVESVAMEQRPRLV